MAMTNTEAVIEYLKKIGLFSAVKDSIMKKIVMYMSDRVKEEIEIEIAVFYGSANLFGKTSGVEDYLIILKEAE